MSAYIFGRVLYHPTITTAQKITLAAIADVVNDHGFGWMLVSTLRLKTSLSERGVQKALSELIDMGLLKRRVRRDQCSQFLIVLDALPLKPAPNDREADLPEGWGAPDAPRPGAPDAGGGARRAGGGAPDAGGGAPGAPITLTEPGNETENTPLSYGEDTPTQEIDLFGKQDDAPKIELHDRVVAAWNELAQRRPGIAAISTLNDSRRKKIHARAKDMVKVEPDGWKAWQRILIAIEASTYLCGEDPPGRGYTDPFKLNVEYVLRPSEFLKIYDGGYRATRTDKSHDAVSGRRIGPAEQASRAAFTRVRDARAQRGGGTDDRGGEAADGSGIVRTGALRSAFDQY